VPAPLDDVTLARLLDDALTAPSPHDLQPTRFVVVRDPAARARLASAAYGQRAVAEASAVVVVLADLHPEGAGLEAWLAARVEAGEMDAAEAARRRALAERAPGRWTDRGLWAVRPAAMAAGRMIAAADSHGLAARMVDDFDHGQVRAAVGIPDDHALVALVVLDAGEPDPPPLDPRPLSAFVWDDHFGRPTRLDLDDPWSPP
jgi:nitroreductase